MSPIKRNQRFITLSGSFMCVNVSGVFLLSPMNTSDWFVLLQLLCLKMYSESDGSQSWFHMNTDSEKYVNLSLYRNWSGTYCLLCAFCDVNTLVLGFPIKMGMKNCHRYFHVITPSSSPWFHLPPMEVSEFSQQLWRQVYMKITALRGIDLLLIFSASFNPCLAIMGLGCTPVIHPFIRIIWHQVLSCLNRVQHIKGETKTVLSKAMTKIRT